MYALNNKYIINIYERYLDLKNSNKPELDNNDLWKIFEYYSCLKLSEEYKKPFYEYDDIDPTFKELNKMSRNDTGIDLSDLDKTIVQCKLRKNTLTWKECSTFFGSQVIFDKEHNKAVVRWDNLIITRNNDCILSENLLERKDLFIDRPYIKQELIKFCENLITNPPEYPIVRNDFILRDYQIESINIITQNKKNVIISLPTGTGKNSVIIYSFQENKKYLILVPRIILMEQLKDEIIKHKPALKNKIQLIGDANNEFKDNKNITICVFNSVSVVESHCCTFEYIYIDEAHHINKPDIYCYEDDNENITDEKEEPNNNEYDDTDNEQTDDEYEENQEEELIDDTEDELKNVKSYTQIIKSLVKHNNNVYLSATIDKIENFEYYSKDIRDMINLGYLCDYTIHIPIFSEDPNNTKICEHLLKNYRNIIIYCNSQKEGKEINKIMNKLQNNSSMYIDCKTPKKKRNDVIEKYKRGEIPFLVNVRILVEGFDSPITKGVVFLHLPNNKTTLIQIIGRCLRLHPSKTIANIILPFSSKEDEKNIGNFLKTMAKNDSHIKKSFENKRFGGYISIDIAEEIDNEDINNDIEFKHNMIYDSMCVLKNGEEIWMKRLDEVKKYIDDNNKRPSSDSKNNKIKKLGRWLFHQLRNYKNKNEIMKIPHMYDIWTAFVNDNKYKQYFMTNDERWLYKFEELNNYLDNYETMLHIHSKNIKIQRMFIWHNHQVYKFKNKTQIMKKDNIYNIWCEFVKNPKYEQYFMSDEKKWLNNFNKSKEYIDKYNKRPSDKDDDFEIAKLSRWIQSTNISFKTKTKIMNINETIYNTWDNFVNHSEYKKYFQSKELDWYDKIKEVLLHIDENKKAPSTKDNCHKIRSMGLWVSAQKELYNKKKEIMSIDEIYGYWSDLRNNNKYRQFVITIIELWNDELNTLKKYINLHNKKPSRNDDNLTLYYWTENQQRNFKNKTNIMKNDDIYNKWQDFVTNVIYKKYFTLNTDKWDEKLELVKQYISLHNKRPSSEDENLKVKHLGAWILNQIHNNKDINNCIDVSTYNKWITFINDEKYKQYFMTKDEIWLNNLEKLKKYININKHRPGEDDDNFVIRQLSKWLSHQITYYNNKTNIMLDDNIYDKWKEFINEPQYNKYLMTNDERWHINFNNLKIFVYEHNKRPSSKSKIIDEKRLADWTTSQVCKYNKKNNIMKNISIQHLWYDFVTDIKYKQYFNQDIIKPKPLPIET
jgi:superfamily II DNA or RNA helicase